MLHALSKAPSDALPSLIWALGRTGEKAAHAAVGPLLDHAEDAVRKSAAECLLRLGDPDVIQRCMVLSANENWPVTALGLGGGPKATDTLLDQAKQGAANEDCLIALGLLGSLIAVKAILFIP